MRIGTREVGPGSPVFIVAEIGSNHGGSLDRALALIDAAADAGADAAKFQRYRVDRFLVPRPDPESLRRYELPDEWLPKLKARCTERGVEFLCTAFDLESLAVIDPFVNAHKVGSWEAAAQSARPLVRAAVKTGKPVILSLGKAWGWPRGIARPRDSVVLKCRSVYPAPVASYLMRQIGGVGPVWAWGVSDHTLHPTIIPAAAVALGACVVEKHMRLGVTTEDDEYPDASVSISPQDFARLVDAVRLTESAVRGA